MKDVANSRTQARRTTGAMEILNFMVVVAAAFNFSKDFSSKGSRNQNCETKSSRCSPSCLDFGCDA